MENKQPLYEATEDTIRESMKHVGKVSDAAIRVLSSNNVNGLLFTYGIGGVGGTAWSTDANFTAICMSTVTGTIGLDKPKLEQLNEGELTITLGESMNMALAFRSLMLEQIQKINVFIDKTQNLIDGTGLEFVSEYEHVGNPDDWKPGSTPTTEAK